MQGFACVTATTAIRIMIDTTDAKFNPIRHEKETLLFTNAHAINSIFPTKREYISTLQLDVLQSSTRIPCEQTAILDTIGDNNEEGTKQKPCDPLTVWPRHATP